MKTFNVTCTEVVRFIKSVEAESMEEAISKVRENVNSFETVLETVGEWEIDDIEEVYHQETLPPEENYPWPDRLAEQN